MNIIPCAKSDKLKKLIRDYSENLKTEAHKIGTHGLAEEDFYNSGLFRGSIERVRGQFSATMRHKREFMQHVLNFMQDGGFIKDWESAGGKNRHDYVINMPSGKVSVVELKGCLDGNNTNIFDRPANAQEFFIWSICMNLGNDPQKSAWSGIHTRLSADIIERQNQVDGLVMWDMVCGTAGRPCPKLINNPGRLTEVAHYKLPPPCLYIFPGTIASPRNNPKPTAQALTDLELMTALHKCFKGADAELNYVDFEVEHQGADTVRLTRVRRDGIMIRESQPTPIRRS